jgi:FkbM family methyltransferase
MAVLVTLLTYGLAFYLHKTPAFPGKRRTLAPFKALKGLPVRSHYGVMLRLDPADRTNWYGVTGGYGDVVADEIKKLKVGDCFIDVGANCGVFSLLAREMVGGSGVVIAFEPYFETFYELVSNIHLNGFHNVYPINACVSDHSGILHLTDRLPHHSGLGSVALEGDAASITAPCVSISEFPAILSLVGDRNTLIKIDVEGYEMTVLRGTVPLLRSRSTTRIVVEINREHLDRYQATVDELYDFLGSFDFVPTKGPVGVEHFDEVFYRA